MAKKSTKEGRKSKSSSEKSSNNKSSNATKGKESGSKREKTAKGKCTASRKAKNKSTFSGKNREHVPSTEPSTQFEVTKDGSAMQLERRDSQTEAKYATTAPNMAPKRYYSVIFQNPYLFPDAPESKSTQPSQNLRTSNLPKEAKPSSKPPTYEKNKKSNKSADQPKQFGPKSANASSCRPPPKDMKSEPPMISASKQGKKDDTLEQNQQGTKSANYPKQQGDPKSARVLRSNSASSTTSQVSGGLSRCFDGHVEVAEAPQGKGQKTKTFVPGKMQNFDSETSIIESAMIHRGKQATHHGNNETNKDLRMSSLTSSMTISESSTQIATGRQTQEKGCEKSDQRGGKIGSQENLKLHLICGRSFDGSAEPLGILYGSIKGYVDCRNATHALTSNGLLREDAADFFLDISQVDASDSANMKKIKQIEAKDNLVTIAPYDEASVLLFDQTGRGIGLANTGHIKLNGDCISLVIAHLDKAPGSKYNHAGSLERNRYSRKKPHKIQVLFGMAMLLLGKAVGNKSNSASGKTPLQIDLLLIAQASNDATIAVDDASTWNARSSPYMLLSCPQPKPSSTQEENVQSSAGSLGGIPRGKFNVRDFSFTEVTDSPVEYLLLLGIRTGEEAKLSPLGLVTGQVDGVVSTPSTRLQGMRDPSLMLNMVLLDSRNRGLMAFRRQILSAKQALSVTVSGSASANISGDMGGGYILGANTQLTLLCDRLLQLTNSTPENGGGHSAQSPNLAKCRQEDVTAQSEGQLALYMGEVTLLVTDGAHALAYYIH